jgi:hypothetical protein
MNPHRIKLKKQNVEEGSIVRSKESRLASHLYYLSTSTKLIKKMESESKILVSYLINISANSERVFKDACTIEFSEITKALIDLLRNSDSSLSVDLKVFVLKIFRTMIELENPASNSPASDWNATEFKDLNSRKKILKRQNQLVGLELVDLLVDLLSNSKNEKEIKNEAILVSISLLYGGNFAAQEAFYQKIKADENNCFLNNYKKLLVQSFENVKKSMSHLNKKINAIMTENQKQKARKPLESIEDEKGVTLTDDNEGLGVRLHEDDAKELVLLKRLFRFLQLLCEG